MFKIKNDPEQMFAVTCTYTVTKPPGKEEVIRMITADELKFQDPKVPFMTTTNAELYKGEFCGFQVAIKRYAKPEQTSPR